MTEPTSKLITNGARFDVTLGKRIPVKTFWENNSHETFFLGVDGGMLASLHREKTRGLAIFATETFDGFFGTFLTYARNGYLTMLRWGHLSAHLVDNAPNFNSPLTYSHFFGELNVGKSIVDLNKTTNWDLYVQSTVGMNYETSPAKNNPRFKIGIDSGYSPWGPDRWAFLGSFDCFRQGVLGQKPAYSTFFGMGYLNKPESSHRPLRVGVMYTRGGDYRNQYALAKSRITALEIQTEF